MIDLSKLVKLRVPLKGRTVCAETLWATSLGKDRYRLENDPIHVKLLYRDVVIARPVRGRLTFKRFVLRVLNSSP